MSRCVLPLVLVLSILTAGSAVAQNIAFDDSWGRPGFTVVEQTPTGMEIVYSVPEIRLGTLDTGNGTRKTVSLPGVFLPNDAGAPNLPGTGRFVAVPQGAAYTVTLIASRTRTFAGLDVAPAAPIPREDDDSPPVYTEDPAIYGTDAAYPARPVTASRPRVLRGVDTFVLGVTPFAYNPVQKELVVYTDLRIRVSFTGGNGRFGDPAYRSRWLEPMLEQHLLNHASLPVVDFDGRPQPLGGRGRQSGCEYMIFCPDDPAFLAWADVIRTFRVRQGISTEVFNIDDFGGTAAGIEAAIDDAYRNWQTKPVAALFVGDLPAMPALRDGSTLSDNMYADVDGDDLPELNVARLTARNEAELHLLVAKFIDYETNPPANAAFYANPIMAGGWQTERWFILCAEVVHGFLTNVEGKTPVREYALYSGSPGTEWSTNQNTYMILDYFGPNGLGYIPTTPGHLTDWGANATRLNNDINSGAFYMLHRDHGSQTGWGEPDYDINDLAGLTNTDLCFVMSINCLTGKYDHSPQCFAEAFHRMRHGALGVIAASATSYSFVNDTFVWGMHDSMWPNFDPGYGGSAGQAELMPGFANMSGKWYLEASSWPYNTSSKTITYHLFHHHGDAFSRLFSEVPQPLTVTHGATIDSADVSFDVSADAGSLIALAAHGRVLGTATATGGTQTIPIDPAILPGVMTVTVTKANHTRYEGQVAITTTAPIAVWLPDGHPDSVLPGPVTNVTVQILDGVEQYVAGTGLLHYRFDPGALFDTAPLTSLGADLFNAALPGARPDSLPEFYVSADHTGGGTITAPPTAPAATYTMGVDGLPVVIFKENFETGMWAPYWRTETTGAGRILLTKQNGPIDEYHVTMDSATSGTVGTCIMEMTIDLAALAEADLYFAFKEWNDEDDPEDGVFLSADGVTYHKAMSLSGDSMYAMKTIDLDEAAAAAGIPLTQAFRIAFSWKDNYEISTDGFAFDEIAIASIIHDASLWAGAYAFSASAGCAIPIHLDAGTAFAGRPYILGAGLSGTHPGTILPGGKRLPVNWDQLTTYILTHLGSPMFQGFSGSLDGTGEAVAGLNLTGPLTPTLAGRRMVLAFTLTGTFDFVSNQLFIDIEP